jgi:hypothetical protein
MTRFGVVTSNHRAFFCHPERPAGAEGSVFRYRTADTPAILPPHFVQYRRAGGLSPAADSIPCPHRRYSGNPTTAPRRDTRPRPTYFAVTAAILAGGRCPRRSASPHPKPSPRGEDLWVRSVHRAVFLDKWKKLP